MIIDHAPDVEGRRPEYLARPIEDDAAKRAAAGRLANPPFGFIGGVSLDAGVKPRPERYSARAQHHHRRQPAPVCNAAGGHDRHPASRDINDRRHDIDGGARRAMTAGFTTLRNQDVGISIKRLTRHLFVLHLADQQRSGRFDLRRERLRVTKGQHDRARLRVQRDIQKLRLLREAPGNETDAEGRARGLFELGRLLLKPRPFAIAAAENAEPAGITHRHHQPRAGYHRHRRQQNRFRDAEALRQRRGNWHIPSRSVERPGRRRILE